MSTPIEIENRAGLARVTCGWKKPDLPLDWVRRYWRDVHSPAIARRAGVYDYRHYQFDPVRSDLLAPVNGIERACPPEAQLMWLSDVRYLDEESLTAFASSPEGLPKAELLADIELIVERSTTYRAVGKNAWTHVDVTPTAAPQGPVENPSYALFFRLRGAGRSAEAHFSAALNALAARWARIAGVLRLRLTLFERPDMEAERKAGYPVKTHPLEQQYQAWIDLVLAHEGVAPNLMSSDSGAELARCVSALHIYPVRDVYTSVYAGRPTLVGLRGFSAYEAIRALGASNQEHPALLEWMYGPVAAGGPIVTAVPPPGHIP